jgi:hypothetical protein
MERPLVVRALMPSDPSGLRERQVEAEAEEQPRGTPEARGRTADRRRAPALGWQPLAIQSHGDRFLSREIGSSRTEEV